MGYYCPVTGLRVVSNPEWLDQKVSNLFIANFWIINESIVYSRPKGYADIHGVRNSLALNKIVANHFNHVSSFVQIEDYEDLEGASIEARRYFTKYMIDNQRLLALVFCNLSQSLTLAVKIGNRFNIKGNPIYVKQNYADAIKHAIDVVGQTIKHTDIAPIDLTNYHDPKLKYLSPVHLQFNDDWNIHTEEYSNYSLVIDQCILHSTSKGHIHARHIPLIDKMRDKIQSELSENAKIK